MAMDLRQIVAALLTLSMFLMLANMIKRDHFDSLQINLPVTSSVENDVIKVTERSLAKLPVVSKSPWKEDLEAAPKPCWSKPEISSGPECHASQIADGVAVARYLGATLVLPNIVAMGSKPRVRRYLGDIYDVEKILNTLDDIVRVTKYQPNEPNKGKLIRVPSRVSGNYIEQNIAPVFRKRGSSRLEIYCPSAQMIDEEKTKHLDSFACLTMFGTLQLQPELQQVVESVVNRLRNFSQKTNGKFVAVDLQKGCLGSAQGARKMCYHAEEVGKFLKKIGFDRDTTIYLTQSQWSSSLDSLGEFFPNTYTKESMLSADKKTKFLNSEISDMEKVIDFYICSQSDVFVPATFGLFYSTVAGMRIASGRNQILVPSQIMTSSVATEYVSPYISEKNHLAYSCCC
ncbi:protein MANNAN SYNTHESIS-RELATED isoform X2 [Ziziphus jujuba]|uniref:O-fucosyltransferase family protein n=1 Tax=Ziziphus jujuba TaxID=326968 RepID=A0ABM3IEK3_ZIZJJ|nr:protein MANNAN SYNTHESIS-RELATED isoform X2 [Ziziphus jujuba]